MYKVPVTSAPNQTIFFTITINGVNLSLELFLRFIDETYWIMDISNHETGQIYLTSIPLVTADDPAQNLLTPYDYLGIGTAYIVATDNISDDGPTSDNLGTSWALLWDDNYDVQDPKGGNTDDIPVWG